MKAQTKSNCQKLLTGLLASLGIILLPSAVLAQSWNNPAGGLWGISGNWTGGVFPNATDAIANFGQLNLSSDVTVTVDGPYTVGRLIFGNSNLSPAHSWTVNYSGSPASDYLNLSASSGIALITVSNLGVGQSATINANLNGTSSLWINGPGTLSLAGNNIYSGTTTTVTNGATLVLGALNTLPTNTILVLGDISNRTVKNFANLQVLNSQTVGGFVSQGNVWLTNTTYPTNFVTIPSGQALTVNGNVILGTNSASGTNAVFLNFSGAGSFLVNNPNGIFRVGAADATSTAAGTAMTFDMSGLSTANINLGSNTQWNTSSFYIGDFSTSGPGGVVPSKCLLATNTTITANSLVVGASRRFNAQSLLLGSGSNVLNVNSILLGTNLDYGQVYFRTNTGSLTVRAVDGVSRAFIGMGYVINTANSAPNQFIDLGNHYADLYLSLLQVGFDRKGGNSSNYFNFGNGILDTTELDIGTRSGNPASAGLWQCTCSLGGGTVNVGSGGILMGVNTTSTNVSTLNIGGGSVTVNGDIILMVQKGTAANAPATSTLAITGGTTTVNGNIYCSKYVVAPGPHTSTLTLNGGALNMSGHFIGASDCIGAAVNYNHFPRVPWTVDVINLQSGTLRDVSQLNGGTVPLVKSGTGTLTLAGVNTYTGGTIVSGGTLIAANDGALGGVGAVGSNVYEGNNVSNYTAASTVTVTGSGNVVVAGGATLQLSGGVNNSYIYPGSQLILNTGANPVNLNYGGTPNRIAGLSFDGGATFQATGTWGSSASGAAHQDNTHFSGTGTVLITTSASIGLTSAANPVAFGQSANLSATVSGAAGTPTGSVTFYTGSTPLGTSSLDGSGTASLSVMLPVDTNLISAVYNGNSIYTPVVSSLLTELVTPTPVVQSGSSLIIQVPAAGLGTNYVLLGTPSLSPANWTPVATNIGTGLTLSFTIPISQTNNQFFKYQYPSP